MPSQWEGLRYSFCIKISACTHHFDDYSLLMRITVDLDEATLAEVMALTGEGNKSPAVAKAVGEYIRRARAREFGRMIREGAFDYPDPDEAANPIPPLRAS
jgi:Arc/MetJ family transcription regulator